MLKAENRLARRHLKGMCAFFLLAMLASISAFAVDWQQYKSPSGNAILTVDPSDESGRGPAEYRMEVNGKEAWVGRRSFTLFDAVITDDGLTAGYSYTQGVDWSGDGAGVIKILLLDSKGSLRLDEAVDRPGLYEDSPPYPYVLGLVLVPESGYFIVRLTDEDSELPEWWRLYQLSSGKLIKTFRASEAWNNLELPDITDAHPIRGTPLVVIHSFIPDSNKLHYGARFAVVDPLSGIVWSLDRPLEYAMGEDRDGERKLIQNIRDNGAIIKNAQSTRFEIKLVETSEAVTFRAVQDRHRLWSVEEVSRRPFGDLVGLESIRRLVPERPLKRIGRFSIKAPRADDTAAPVHDIRNFNFGPDGRIGFARVVGKRLSLVVIDQDGKLLRSFDLGDFDPNVIPLCAWIGGDEWVVTTNPDSAILRVNTNTEEVSRLQDSAAGAIRALTSAGDGTFVVVASASEEDGPECFTIEEKVIAYDREGKRLWVASEKASENSAQEPERDPLIFPDDVAVMDDGGVAVLDITGKSIHIYNSAGRRERTIDLEKVRGKEIIYPTDISILPDGGLMFYDSGTTNVLVAITKDYKFKNEIQPLYDDGRLLMPLHGIHISPQGNVWVSDGTNIMRLTAEGIVDRVLGQRPNVNQLGTIADLGMDRDGRLYAVDNNTGVVHVFGPSGNPVRRCEPLPADLAIGVIIPKLHVSDLGEVFMIFEGIEEDRRLYFDATGERHSNWPALQEDVRAFLNKDRLLIFQSDSLLITDRSAKQVNKIERRPDKKWLGSVFQASVAPDGSFAVLVQGGRTFLGDSWAVAIYGPSGEPIGTIDLDSDFEYSSIAFDGRFIALAEHKGGIWLMDKTGHFLQRFASGDTADQGVSVFLHGDELWSVLFQSGEVQRFQLPRF